jgi:phenylacetate-CoA ligase
MNPLLNPVISFPLLKRYLIDPGRINRSDETKIKRYVNKEFKKIIKYAYNVPLYRIKYKEKGIHPSEINGIEDIKKLPFISKDDLRDNFPNDIIPPGYKNGHVICTGGTTGKPVSIYTDFTTMGIGSLVMIRELNYFNLNWRKSRFVHIGNFNPYRVDLISQENFQVHVKSIFPMKNYIGMDVNQPAIDLINKLDSFKPDIVMTYPAIFQHLAFLKRKGYGKNIKPKLLWTGGAILDDYTRSYVEDAFGCKLLNIYPSVEAGADIAFECLKGHWHIHPDFFYLEAIDENNNLVEEGKRGHVVITRLWGRGTPIIRYTGMDDWVKLISSKKCDCGLSTPIIEGGVEGRMRANIVLPNGKFFPPGAFCFITPVLHNLKTFKVKQYQIVQKKIDQIDVLLVIDDELRNVGPSVEKIAKNIKEIYQKKVGPKVTINVKEVDKIVNEKDSRKPPPIVISHVKFEEGYKVLDSHISKN